MKGDVASGLGAVDRENELESENAGRRKEEEDKVQDLLYITAQAEFYGAPSSYSW